MDGKLAGRQRQLTRTERQNRQTFTHISCDNAHPARILAVQGFMPLCRQNLDLSAKRRKNENAGLQLVEYRLKEYDHGFRYGSGA